MGQAHPFGTRRPRWMARRFACLLLALFVAIPAIAGKDAGPRVETPLLDGWRFHFGETAGDPARPAFDDARWQAVRLPHTWNALGEYRIGRTAATRNLQGAGWYRLEIDRAALPARDRHYLQFDAAGTIADVWVNGRHAGRHAGAFSRFRFDITRLLEAGRNVITVRADNSQPAPGSSTEHVIPLLGDFFQHGGLYRPVALVSVDDAHIALDDHGGPGVYARAVSISADAAELEVLTRLANAGAAMDASARLRLLDAEGATVAETSVPLRLGPGRGESTQRLRVPSPRLWDGRRDPHRYRLVATLEAGGQVLDRVEQRIGIREFRVDPDRGFFLNGRHLPLRGVSRHQDWLGRGWALSPADHARDMALIEEMGANSIRFAHYQHAPEWFELSDARGMVVWAELAFVNKVSFGDSPASPALVENARTQLVEQIRQHYNNPSVATWGIGNEVDIDLAFGRLGPNADARPLLRELHALAKDEDPHRPTVVADCCEDTPGEKVAGLPVLAGISDLMGYNRYYGWYYGEVDDLGPHLDALHAKHPLVPVSVSEYGAGGALTQHTDDPRGGSINAGGRPHPEEFQSWFHEQTWPRIESRDYLWGSWIWNMFDFSSTVRKEGDATDINDKGLVSFDRRVRKDAFFYFKAQWSEEPVLHVTGRRYVHRAYPVTDVRVYSNASRVSLSVNGRDIGSADCVDQVCVFPGVPLQPQHNRVVATASRDGIALTDAVEWWAPDVRDGVAINAGDLAGATVGDRRFGSDAFFEGGTPRRIGGERAKALEGQPGAALLAGYREGDFTYVLPLPAGRWAITVTTLEPDPDRRGRAFDVLVDGGVVLDGVAPRALAGGALLPVTKTFEAQADADGLRVGFRGDAVLSAMDVRRLE